MHKTCRKYLESGRGLIDCPNNLHKTWDWYTVDASEIEVKWTQREALYQCGESWTEDENSLQYTCICHDYAYKAGLKW